jgi:hypothetical protein
LQLRHMRYSNRGAIAVVRESRCDFVRKHYEVHKRVLREESAIVAKRCRGFVSTCVRKDYLRPRVPPSLSPQGEGVLMDTDLPPNALSGDSCPATNLTRLQLHCTQCSYGAVAAAPPDRCPMCGGDVWEMDPWRPFTSLIDDLAPSRQRRGAAESRQPSHARRRT